MTVSMELPFADRASAGRILGAQLAALRLVDPIVLALPRGGVPVGLEVARALKAPLDLLLVRKIGAPYQPELAIAAVLDGAAPVVVVDEVTRAQAGVERDYIDRQAQIELAEIERRRRVYLAGRAPLPVTGRTVIIVDDGIATGTTVRAAIKALRARQPAQIVVAVPVAPAQTVSDLSDDVDRVLCLAQPVMFGAISLYYSDFHQLSDDEVVRALAAANSEPATSTT